MLNITIKGTVSRGAQPPVGPTGGYEFTLPGYQQATRGATEKRTHSEQSGKSGSSGYQSHVTGVHHVSEKRPSNYSRQQVIFKYQSYVGFRFWVPCMTHKI